MKKIDIFKNERQAKITFALIELATLVAAIAFWFVSDFWCATSVAFLIWNLYWYQTGSHSRCIDEWSPSFPTDGMHYMFVSWVIFIALFVVAIFVF